MTETKDLDEGMIRIVACDASDASDDGISFTEELVRTQRSIRIVAKARSNSQLLQLLDKGIAADMVLLDINLPNTNGLRLIEDIDRYHTQYKVLVFSTLEKMDTIKRAISFGAVGFLYKRGMMASFFTYAIERVHKYGYYTDLFVTDELYAEAKRQRAGYPETGIFSLTRQQEAVLKLLAQGKINKEIATALGLKTKTVDEHCWKAYKKLGVSTRGGAIEGGVFRN